MNGIITYRVRDAAVTALNMDGRPHEYVHLQGQAVLKRIVSQYRYITYDGSPSLLSEQAHLAEQMREQLQAMVEPAGVEVLSFQLSDLAYAPEVAADLLVRQRAQAMVDAQKLLVAGAVGIAVDAVAELDRLGAAGPTDPAA